MRQLEGKAGSNDRRLARQRGRWGSGPPTYKSRYGTV